MRPITKLDAARRTLSVAIRLFFAKEDGVAIHTLAAAAQTAMRDLAKNESAPVSSIIHDHPVVPENRRRAWISAINRSANFMKHADKDPDQSLEFAKEEATTLILDASLVLTQLAGQVPPAVLAFLGWFAVKQPEMRVAFGRNDIADLCATIGIDADDFEWFRFHAAGLSVNGRSTGATAAWPLARGAACLSCTARDGTMPSSPGQICVQDKRDSFGSL